MVLAWGMRNALHEDFQVLPARRASQIWSMRALQAEKFTLMSSIHCVISEYFTRQYDRTPRVMCRPEGFVHPAWFDACPYTNEGARTCSKRAQGKILSHLPSYLLQSVVWSIEYHFPYVNGWGKRYNILAALGSVIIYAGCGLFVLRLRQNWHPGCFLFLAIILYGTAVFSLTQALSRYRTPTLPCYIAFAALGYASLMRGKEERS